MKLKQQDFKDLEQYIDLTCNINVHKNVFPSQTILEDNFKGEVLTFFHVLNSVFRKQFNRILGFKNPKFFQQVCLVKIDTTDVQFNFKNKKNYGSFKRDPLYYEYTKYQNNIDKFKDKPIILIHGEILKSLYSLYYNDFPNEKENYLYQIDGMHRVMSCLEAGIQRLPAYVIMLRRNLHQYIDEKYKQEIYDLADKCTWFPRYQEIKEVGLEGQRKQVPRYTHIYDFSILRDKIVVDFGGNIGQAALESYFNEAKRIYSCEIQKPAYATGKKICQVLIPGYNNQIISFPSLDFNHKYFEKNVLKITPKWDWTIFQAIYRTKEIKDIERNFKFIVENTREGIFFEGNGDPRIDTQHFYNNIFNKFNFKEVKYLGLSEQRPAFRILK